MAEHVKPLVDQPTAAPTRKVTAATLGAAVATLIVFAVGLFTDVEIPPGVEGALAVVLVAVLGYFVRDRG